MNFYSILFEFFRWSLSLIVLCFDYCECVLFFKFWNYRVFDLNFDFIIVVYIKYLLYRRIKEFLFLG